MFLVLRKKWIIATLLVILSAIMLSINVFGGTSAAVFFGDSPRLVPIYNVDITDKKVAITFDSAWGADKTQGIIDLLKEYGANATFFLVGFWAEKYPDMVRAIDEAGLEIGTHSNTHPDFTNLSEVQMKQELELSMNTIKSITGKDVKLFRSPYGAYNNTSINVASSLGLTTIQWNVDTLDWKGISAGEIAKRVSAKVVPGSIILMHNNSDNVLDGLRLVLDYLKSSGYEVTSVGNIIMQENFYIDHAGVQHKNN